MTHLADASRGSDVVARWCSLAEQRLEHLTELFETGRWRRYHNEVAFLENIQEAKAAVETWRGLMTGKAVPDKSATDVADLVAEIPALPRYDEVREPLEYFPPEPALDASEPRLEREIPDDFLAALESQLMAGDVPSVTDAPGLDDLALEDSALEDSALEDSALEDLALQDLALDGVALDDLIPRSIDLDMMQARYPLLRNAL